MYITQNFKIKIHMKSLKTILSIFFILLATTNGFSQTNSKDVSITSSGSGKTLDDAKQAALRSATEQAFGAFISSKTEMFNDQVLANQISSVSSGNIKSYSILNESQLPDSSWGVTLKAEVSLSKLTSFVEAKGIAIEIKGGMFALKIKQLLLNEQNERNVIFEIVSLLHRVMQISFDYVIKSSEPQALDGQNINWGIPLRVEATFNKNIDFCANYCIKTLAAISLSDDEVYQYQRNNKSTFPVVINYKGVAKTFYLRKKSSLNVLKTLTSNFEFYSRLFTLELGIDSLYGNEIANDKGEGSFYVFTSNLFFLNFPHKGEPAALFLWQDKRTLSEIEQITGYKVKPRGVVSQIKHGGLVVFEENGHGLVTAMTDLGNEMDWNSAKTACEELILNGYSDWYLPSKEELNSVYVNLKQVGVGGFADNSYWSSTENDGDDAWRQHFDDGRQSKHGNAGKNDRVDVRAVRAF